MENAHKKNVDLMSSSVILRSWTTFFPQLQRTSPRLWRERRCCLWGKILKVSKFQNNQISYFAFSYSMMCIKELCGFIP